MVVAAQALSVLQPIIVTILVALCERLPLELKLLFICQAFCFLITVCFTFLRCYPPSLFDFLAQIASRNLNTLLN